MRKTVKVKAWFKVRTNDYYNNVKYRTRTVEIELPVDRYGFTLENKISDKLREILSPSFGGFVLLSHQVMSVIETR